MAKTFDFEHTYFIEKPAYKRKSSCEKWWMFSIKERNGNNIIFSNRDRNDHKDYQGKVLSSSSTSNEVCFITIEGERYLLEAKNSFSKGQQLNKENLKRIVVAEFDSKKQDFVKTKDCGQSLGEFLSKKAKRLNK